MKNRRGSRQHLIPRQVQYGFLAALVVLAAVLVAVAVTRNDRLVSSATPAPAPSSERSDAAEPITVVTVLGDSFTGGSAMNSGPTWLGLLGEQNGWITKVEASGGSGYSIAGPFGGSFPERADLGAYASDLVIIAGGINDEGAINRGDSDLEAVRQGARQAIEEAIETSPCADVVVFSSFANGETRKPLADISAQVQAEAEAAGVQYLDVSTFLAGDPSLIGEDGTHPTDEGHAVLAEKIGPALEALGVPVSDRRETCELAPIG